MIATRSWLIISILFLLGVVSASAAEDAGERAARIVDEVRQLKDADKQAEAAALLQRTQQEYEAAVQKNPNDALARYGLAMILHHQQQVPAATAHLQRALELQPRHAQMHCFRGKILAMDKKPVEAEQAFRRALELAPKDLKILGFYGFWLASVHRYDEAVKVMRTLLEMDPNNQEVPVLLASALLAQDKVAEWEQTLREAIKRHPQNVEFRDFLAKGYYWQKQYGKAYAERLQIKRLTPDGAHNEAQLLNLCKFLTRPVEPQPHLDRIYELHRTGKYKDDSFGREEFFVRGTRVLVQEYFEVKERTSVKYRFVVLKDDDKPDYMIAVSSFLGGEEFQRGEPARPDAKRVSSVDAVRDESQDHFGMFAELTYEQSRALVIEIMEGKRTPFTRNETAEREKKSTIK